MSDAVQEKILRMRKELYLAVRNNEPELYRKAVEIGHLAHSAFERDDLKRSANVEAAVMSLIAEIKGITR